MGPIPLSLILPDESLTLSSHRFLEHLRSILCDYILILAIRYCLGVVLKHAILGKDLRKGIRSLNKIKIVIGALFRLRRAYRINVNYVGEGKVPL